MHIKNIIYTIIILFFIIFSTNIYVKAQDTEKQLSKGQQIPLSKEEKEWLSKHKNIRMGVGRGFYPFQFMDEGEIFKGMAADYVSLLNEKLSVNMYAIPNLSWKQVLVKAYICLFCNSFTLYFSR